MAVEHVAQRGGEWVTGLALGLVFVWLLGLSILMAALRLRVGKLTRLVSNKDAEKSKLSAELEAQALLARQMSLDLDELRKRLSERDEVSQAPATSWPGIGVPVNLNRRGQILRLSRKGKSVAEIASDLNVAQGEVELLLKVHDLTHNGVGPEK